MESNYNFDSDHIEWTHIQDPEAGYPCDYKMAVLGADPKTGRLDLIVKWPPNSYCHFHRHVADTTILVLEGEQHIIEIAEDGTEGEHKVRPAGTYASSPGGDAHMEHGGPEGATVFFAMQSTDGKLFEMLDREMNLLDTTTVEQMAEDLSSS
jgi:hypothetical protein